MKRLNLEFYAVLLVLIALLAGCSGPAENSGASNANAPQQQANANSAAQPQIAQAAPPEIAQAAPPAVAPSPAPPTVQQIPPPSAPAAKPATAGDANAAKAANASGAANTRAPKLIAPEKKLDFGKQPQDKSLVRAIPIRNGGRADLNIESVAPS